MLILKEIIKKAKNLKRIIVYPEAGFSERIVEAGQIVANKKIAKVIFIGDESALVLKYPKLKNITIINPKTSALTEEFVNVLFDLRKDKGITLKKAKELVLDPIYFSTLMVHLGYADGMVGGAETSTLKIIKPALQIIKIKDNCSMVSSFNILYGKHKLLDKNKTIILADCGLNINPSAEELAQITIDTVNSTKFFTHLEPRVALLSFSTKGSADSVEVKKVTKALSIIQEKLPKTIIDGELQLDAALLPFVANLKAPKSPIQGNANILIFPDLQSGNIACKAIEKFGKLNNIGPIMQCFKKPINDLSRGCDVNSIILITAITAIQTQNLQENL